MAMNVNKVILIGRLGRDPDVRAVPNSTKNVASFSLATTESWREKHSGEYKSKTEWHYVVVWNEHLVNMVKSHIRKGAKVYVEGVLDYRKWQDKNGQDRVSTEIIVKAYAGSVILLEKSPENISLPDNDPDTDTDNDIDKYDYIPI